MFFNLLCLFAILAVALGDSLRRELTPGTPINFISFAFYKGTGCAAGTLYEQQTHGIDVCVVNKDSTSFKYTMTGDIVLTVTSYSDNACATAAGNPVVVTYSSSCAPGSADNIGASNSLIVTASQIEPDATLEKMGTAVIGYNSAFDCNAGIMELSAVDAVLAAPGSCLGMLSDENTFNFLKTTCTSLTSFSYQVYTDNTCATPLTVASGSGNSPPACVLDPQANSDLGNYNEIFCSSYVAPATMAPTKAATCFASSETVTMESGEAKALSAVALGDRILTANMDGSLKGFSEVIAIPHADAQTKTTFARITTQGGKDIKMTPSHLVLAGDCNANLSLVQAGSVEAGQCMQTVDGQDQVLSNTETESVGMRSVVTKAGDLIVVNGVVASPFAVNHWLAEAWYTIHRGAFAVFPALLANKLFTATSESFGDLAVEASF